MKLELKKLKETLDTSLMITKQMLGSDDPNFKRIHHHYHHIVLYIKDYIMKERCKTYFETGTHFGHSLCNVLQSKYPSKFVSCDLFRKGAIARDCKIVDVEKLANENAKAFNVKNYECKIFKGNSVSSEMYSRVKEEFPNGIDLLFIDGDHSLRGVTKDFNTYFPLVNSGGYIVFDDYLPFVFRNKKRGCPIAVDRLVEKYKDQLNVIGVIDDLVGCNNERMPPNPHIANETKNIDFIIQKL
jgi:predicted O-methyltransferase YrrM